MPPIQFEEVTAQIERDPQTGPTSQAQQPQAAPAEDLAAQLDRELRLRAERMSRVCTD